MIYCLVGENAYMRAHELARLVGERPVEVYDAADLDVQELGNILDGQTLFADERVVCIRHASTVAALWNAIGERVADIDESMTLFLIETNCDKRTKTYKTLQRAATMIVCDPWSERQVPQAKKWLIDYAASHAVAVSESSVGELVQRAIHASEVTGKPIIDQQLLATVVEQLAGAEQVTPEVIDAVMAPSTHDNVFGLLEAALDGNIGRLDVMLTRLRHVQDGHRTLALLASQATNFAALVLSNDRPLEQVAGDIGVHPFALRAMKSRVNAADRQQLDYVVECIALADRRAKRGQSDAWPLIESALRSIALHSANSLD
ncbi:hypothetical protein CR983_03110 [Candidatus Saccharibacteria bacterium]|nr:MAG: hypothetical protein CR983_03110 [Candidatus Saccharibacteria bacterium]